MSNYQTYTIRCDRDSMEAVKSAIRMGALSGQRDALVAHMNHNRGTQLADAAERELRHLELGADAILSAEGA